MDAWPSPGIEDVANRPGAGAAGGLGFGIMAFGGGRLETGASWFLDHSGARDILDGAALVITAEGAFDRTSLEGKLTGHMIALAGGRGIPCLLLAPSVRDAPGDIMPVIPDVALTVSG